MYALKQWVIFLLQTIIKGITELLKFLFINLEKYIQRFFR
ncbi:hypothetical protein CQU01_09150 [Cerasibacillus quisquiliarum]|uniref:Uncharacterized protein n=1 Tax=Cerasibacillus quisquiliarum TaxID=227865 RepID=A0A511UVR5_9BACI|nr:hypothetical protein CQU01_09150 [Cerasibacillus quisquiliarum]